MPNASISLYKWGIVLFLVMFFASPAFSITHAGLSIESQAEIIYSSGHTTSESIAITVNAMYGSTIESVSLSAEVSCGTLNYYSHTISNLGNGSNNITLYFLNPGGDTWNYAMTKDDNMNGLHESGENTPLDDPLLISEDGVVKFFVVVMPPTLETTGITREVHLVATGEVDDGSFYYGANGEIYGGPDTNHVYDFAIAQSGQPSSLEVERSGSDVKLKWQGNVLVDIYVLSPEAGLYYDYNGSWTKAASSTSTLEWVDTNAHLYSQRYYRVAAKDTTKFAIDANGSYEAVGKFNIPVSESDPTKFFMSNPLLAKTNSIADVFQGEAQEGEFVVYVNSNGYPLQASQFFSDVWWDLNTGDTSNMQIMGGKGYGYQAVSSRNIVLVGKVGSEDNVSTIEGGALAYYIGSAFPREYTLPESGLNVSSKGYDSQSAGIMSYVDINGIPTESWMHVEDNAWYDLFTGDISTIKMKPGKGYVFSEPTQSSITWVQPKP